MKLYSILSDFQTLQQEKLACFFFSLIPHFTLGIEVVTVTVRMVMQQQKGPALFYFSRCAATLHRLQSWGGACQAGTASTLRHVLRLTNRMQ
jgi:hypothetical protein